MVCPSPHCRSRWAHKLVAALPKESSRLTLICTNLPPECNEQIMSALFSQYV
jgi:hypothetical protein